MAGFDDPRDSAPPAGFVDHVVDLLGPLDASARRMFGGHGLFRDGLMYALITDDRLYIKADDTSRAAFTDAGGGPFTYRRSGKPASLSYFSIPDDALEDTGSLRAWAEHGIAAARRAAAAKRGRKKPARERP